MTDIVSTQMERLGPPGWEPHDIASAALNTSQSEFTQHASAPFFLLLQNRGLTTAAVSMLVMRTCTHPDSPTAPMTALVTELEPDLGGAGASLPPASESSDLAGLLDTLTLEGAVIVPVRKGEQGRPLVLGRSSTADIPVRHSSISKLHALLSYDDEGCLNVREAGSKNGTFIDGARIDPQQPVAVGSGTRLTFGKLQGVAVDASTLWRILDGVAR